MSSAFVCVPCCCCKRMLRVLVLVGVTWTLWSQAGVYPSIQWCIIASQQYLPTHSHLPTYLHGLSKNRIPNTDVQDHPRSERLLLTTPLNDRLIRGTHLYTRFQQTTLTTLTVPKTSISAAAPTSIGLVPNADFTFYRTFGTDSEKTEDWNSSAGGSYHGPFNNIIQDAG